MKLYDPASQSAASPEAASPMHESRPALQLVTGRPRARITLGALTAICGLFAIGAATLLVADLADGGRGVSEKWGLEFPTWAAMLGGLVAGTAGARHSYVAWSATGARHGVLDQVLEPGGLRIVHRRWLGRHHELVVRRNERLRIAASLRSSSHGGTNRSYRFVISSPSGSMRFTQSVWIERLSLAPLAPTARALRIEVETVGEATSIAREPAGAPPARPRGA